MVIVATLLLACGASQAAQAQRARDPAHPFTIVVLSPPPAGAAADSARATLEQAAKARGLPVSVVPLAVSDAAGVPVPDDTLLQNARQLGGEAVLVGHAADAAGSTDWQWRLLTGYGVGGWSGPLEAGIQGAADAFARADDVQAGPPVSVVVTVTGVAGLQDYARVQQLLAGLPGAQAAGLAAADGATASFQLLIRGGGAAVTRTLAGSPHLAAAGGDAGLRFQYQP